MPQRRFRLSYANVAATLALVLAMGGSAYAAHSYLITSKSQIKPSVRKALKGNAGKVGPAGVAGATGATGATGIQGPSNPSATTVDGETVTKIRDDITSGATSYSSFYSADGLTLLAECDGSSDLGIEFQASDGNSEVNMSGYDSNGDETPSFAVEQFAPIPWTAQDAGFVDETTGVSVTPLFNNNPGTNQGAGVLAYSNTSGQSVTVNLGWDYSGAFEETGDCGVWGTAVASS